MEGEPQVLSVGSRVRLDYELSTEDEIVDSTQPSGPLELTLGSGRLHPVIESRLLGLSSGAEFSVVLDPSVGFGAYDPQLRIQVAKRKLPENVRDLPVGSYFESFGPDHKKRLFRILRSDETTLVMEGNHPLAGRTLYLEGKILSIEATTQSSL